MKKFVVACALASITTMVPAAADHGAGTFVQKGTILVGDPVTRSYGGVAEQVSPCLGTMDQDIPEGIAQGVDGYWFALPEGIAGHAATLTAPAPNDVDAWFYDEFCQLIQPPGGSGPGAKDPDAYSMASVDPLPNGNEEGRIPAAAAYVVVDLYVGAAAEFTFTANAV
ncbi:MAG TPA: hypothetical protein VM600_09690 [Actinomycetota bacterium]|nr:hypothetical protein [Actinomycetota bacterium]